MVFSAEKLSGVSQAKLQAGALSLYINYINQHQPNFDEIFRWAERLHETIFDISLEQTTHSTMYSCA